MSKVDLYLEEVFSLMYAFPETYESAMKVPIAIRKWLIKRWNKQKEQEQKAQEGQAASSDMGEPLTPSERMKMIKQSQSTQRVTEKSPPISFMNPTRNNS